MGIHFEVGGGGVIFEVEVLKGGWVGFIFDVEELKGRGGCINF